MSLNHLAALVVFEVVLAACSFAQVNEISGTVGGTFISTQTIQGASFFNHNVNFGTSLSFALNYGRFVKQYGILGLSLEVPLAVAPDTDVGTGQNLVPASYKSFFITPGLRANFFPGEGLSPWVSVGGGYGLFKEAGHLNYYGPNPGSTRTNTGVFEFGVGVDTWLWKKWGLRMEARDFYSGVPQLNVNTGRSRQHNYYVGGGVISRF